MMDAGHGENGGVDSALDYVIDHKTRLTMEVVENALTRGVAVLAYQPIVQADRPSLSAFHEGLIRIIDDSGRFVRGVRFSRRRARDCPGLDGLVCRVVAGQRLGGGCAAVF